MPIACGNGKNSAVEAKYFTRYLCGNKRNENFRQGGFADEKIIALPFADADDLVL